MNVQSPERREKMAYTCKHCGAMANDPGHLCNPCGDPAKCSFCGAQVPRDKAKRTTRYTSLVDSRLFKELRAQGTQIARYRTTKYLCISCAVHRGVVKVRGKNERKTAPRRRRRN